MNTNSATQMRLHPQVASDLGSDAVVEISGALRKLLADVFALYVKTKNFHWHMSGPHFRDYHLLLDEQATQVSRRGKQLGMSMSLGQVALGSAPKSATLRLEVRRDHYRTVGSYWRGESQAEHFSRSLCSEKSNHKLWRPFSRPLV